MWKPRSINPEQADWYEENIEPEISELVKLLRNNGFNTTCSCGHTMTVEIEIYDDEDVTRLANLLIEHGYFDFSIRYNLWITNDLRWIRTLNLEMAGAIEQEYKQMIELDASLGSL